MGKGAVQVRAPVAVHRAAGGLAQAEGVEAVVARPAVERRAGALAAMTAEAPREVEAAAEALVAAATAAAEAAARQTLTSM